MKQTQQPQIPEITELERELKRERYKRKYQRTLRSTVYTLVTVAAAAVLVATLWLPVLEIFGSSMMPTLRDGQIVVSLKIGDMEPGDVIAFYYNNKVLIKRVIGLSGDWVNIDPEGNVYVNGELLEEPYLAEKALGECDIEMPYQVPESHYFVMGDLRSTSVDSRHSSVGCVSEEQIVGKLFMRIWPFEDFGRIG